MTFINEESFLANAQEDQKVFLPIITKPKKHYTILGPDGGSVECIEIDPNNSNIVYGGSWGNGVYKSVDGGATWVNHKDGLASPFIYDIRVDPEDSEHILASVYRHGVFQSVDGGETWQMTQGWPVGSVVYSIEFHPLDSSIIYAGIRTPTIYDPPNPTIYPGYVYKSTDGGSTWINKSNGLALDYVYDLVIDPNNPDVIYAAMHNLGVYRTDNGGESWTQKNYNLQGWDIRSVDVRPDTGTVYAGHWDGKGVSYSLNEGDHWFKVESTNEEDLFVYQLQIDPNLPKKLYLTTSSGIKVCNNANFNTVCTDVVFPGTFVYDLALDINGPLDGEGKTARMFTGLPYLGVYKSTNGGVSFAASYAGIKANVVTSVLNDPVQPQIVYIAVYKSGVWKSLDEGVTWAPINTDLPTQNIILLEFRPGNSNVIYAASDNLGLYRSDNAGGSWISANSGLSRDWTAEPELQDEISRFEKERIYAWMDGIDIEETFGDGIGESDERAPTPAYLDVLTLSFDPGNPLIMIAGTDGYGVMKSDNGGNSWSDTYISGATVHDSFVDPASSPYSYFIGIVNYAVRASDSDRMWWYLWNTGFHSSADVFSFIMVAPGNYFAGTDDGIYHSTDFGQNWSREALTGYDVTDLYLDPGTPSEMYAMTDEGLFRSIDSGTTWFLDHRFFNDQVLSFGQGYGTYPLFLGMNGGNLYRLEP
jgi:photosystem II stability/assembly factor-like uncharacterized protein